jgi:WhiB family redox-sensing transcriptional regulator
MSELPTWREKAACRDEDPELFYSSDEHSQILGKAICGRCIVRGECLDNALKTHQPDGIWGGKTASEREELRTVGAEPHAD